MKIRRNIALYVLVTYGVSWLIWLPLLANRRWGMNLPIVPGQYYLASFGPFFGAIVSSSVSLGWQGIEAWAKRVYSFRFPWRMLTTVIGMLLLYVLVAVPVHTIVTGNWPEWSQFGLTEKLPGFNIFETSLIWMLTFGLGEESGWRGYMLPEL